MWYFSRDSDDKGRRASLCLSFGWFLKYHLGSLALGSLVLTPFSLLYFLFSPLRSLAGPSTRRLTRTLTCLPCILCSSLLPLLHPRSPSAYTLLALTSAPVYTSSRHWSQLTTRWHAEYSEWAAVRWLGKASGTCVLVGAAGWFAWLVAANAAGEEVTSPVMTVIISMIVAYIIASVVMSLVS